ncbi:YncE family protein, partial [Kitasatospora sp. MBT63]
SRAYVANNGAGTVSVIDTAAGRSIGDPVPVGNQPFSVTLTPWNDHLLVTNNGSEANGRTGNSVTAIDTTTNKPVGDPIKTGKAPYGAAVTWTGNLYVANAASNTVTATRLPNSLHTVPRGAAFALGESRLYTTDAYTDSVRIADADATTGRSGGESIPSGRGPSAVATSADGGRAYVT